MFNYDKISYIIINNKFMLKNRKSKIMKAFDFQPSCLSTDGYNTCAIVIFYVDQLTLWALFQLNITITSKLY